jgi:hypothetical protein
MLGFHFQLPRISSIKKAEKYPDLKLQAFSMKKCTDLSTKLKVAPKIM